MQTDWCARHLALLHRIEDGLLALLLFAMILLASLQIVLRNLFDAGWVWADPLLRIMVLWVGLLGALAATRGGRHISIDALSTLFPVRTKALVHVCTSLFATVICAIIAWHATRFVISDFSAQAIAFAGLPAWWFELIVPVAFAMIALRYLVLAVLHLQAWREQD